MNDEIKEILDELKEYASGGMSGLYPAEHQVKQLLDYITNLQQTIEIKKQRIKEEQQEKERYIKFYNELNIWNKELQQENEELKKNQRYYKNGVFSLEYDKETLSDMVDDYKSRCEKASEKLGNYKHYSTPTEEQNSENEDIVDSALNILQNGSDDNE